jgi:hypothetical protein
MPSKDELRDLIEPLGVPLRCGVAVTERNRSCLYSIALTRFLHHGRLHHLGPADLKLYGHTTSIQSGDEGTIFCHFAFAK